jgi:hypothetical protein
VQPREVVPIEYDNSLHVARQWATLPSMDQSSYIEERLMMQLPTSCLIVWRKDYCTSENTVDQHRLGRQSTQPYSTIRCLSQKSSDFENNA